MILYNVTVGIDKEVESDWLEWMRSKHIPDVMATGMFTSYKMFKVLSQEEEGSTSYSVQYFAETVEDVVKYLDHFSAPLVREHLDRYKDRHVAFRTLLEQVG